MVCAPAAPAVALLPAVIIGAAVPAVEGAAVPAAVVDGLPAVVIAAVPAVVIAGVPAVAVAGVPAAAVGCIVPPIPAVPGAFAPAIGTIAGETLVTAGFAQPGAHKTATPLTTTSTRIVIMFFAALTLKTERGLLRRPGTRTRLAVRNPLPGSKSAT
jgi:hypothetical protein